jgi:DNA mismatch repair protein MutS2
MNDQVFEKLEFAQIREALVVRCANGLGKQLARRIGPSPSITMVKRWLGQVEELRVVAEEIGLPPLGSIHDIRQAVRDSEKPAGLEAEDLSRIALALNATGDLCRWGTRLPEDAPLLASLVERVGDYSPLAYKIHEAIDGRGRVRDHASSKLKSIRATIEHARSQIKSVYDRILKRSSIVRYLQYAGVTLHGDRKVLPLKAEHRGRIDGIIHRSSDSGATLFVEPTEAVELNNSIVRLSVEEHKEITRILAELSRFVHSNSEGILKTLEAVAVIDVLGAKLKYARDYEAVVPLISDDGVLELREARHPVLEVVFERQASDTGERRQVVPITVRLGDDFDLLIITGPNTGGKTIALKTIGLCAIMTQSGIPIPAARGTKMPVYKNVFVDIGDEQSIEQSLSTFSSHLTNILEVLRKAGPRSLVLMDEVGAGTDPDEGAAIGRAVVDELLRLGAKGVMTTHLSALKAVAFTQSRVDNASVEFDVETLRPMYRLRLGEPGNSNALIIAERLGMPSWLIKSAQSHMDDRHQALQRAIDGTLESRRKAEAARESLEEARLASEKGRAELQERADSLKYAKKEHEQWVAWINELREGDEVFVRSFDRPGKVVRMQFQKQTALVSSGTLDFEVRLQELSRPGEAD